ncbi:hypothetical protein LJB98_01960 [Bacteroidales bacterium OttesenSCG-928-M11]|nr:hypothetical protein [Bacteroidales bacterium OttesenSCG-928-M11]
MKKSNLFIGIGAGLLVGAAIGFYFATTDDEKKKIVHDLDQAVDKAKKSIKKAVNNGLDDIDYAAERINRKAENAYEKIKSSL